MFSLLLERRIPGAIRAQIGDDDDNVALVDTANLNGKPNEINNRIKMFQRTRSVRSTKRRRRPTFQFMMSERK